MQNQADLKQRYQEIQTAIQQASDRSKKNRKIHLIAVSKGQTVEAIEALYDLGQRDFGENYVQELISKASLLNERGLKEIRWHFIGHLQTNKVNAVLPFLGCLHTLDSLKLAHKVAKSWNLTHPHQRLDTFVEVNLGDEVSKSGISPKDAPSLTHEIHQIPQLRLEGLMCIPPQGRDPKESFRSLRKLEEQCRPFTQGHLSMGMSDDFEQAIEEGASHVRVGTALFGPRHSP